MRLGCGCGPLILIAALGAALGTGWIWVRMLQEPAVVPPRARLETERASKEKTEELESRTRGTRPASRHMTLTLSESEVAAFLSHEAAQATDLSVSDLRVRLPGAHMVDLSARIRLGDLLVEPPAATLGSLLAERWLERRVWVHLLGTARIEPGGADGRRRYLRLDVREFSIGRQRLPAALPRLLFDPGALRILRWPLPRDVEDVTIDAGRITVRSAS